MSIFGSMNALMKDPDARPGAPQLLIGAALCVVIYAAAAGLSGAYFLVLAVRVWREKTAKSAVRLFGYSILYLGILFGAMVFDRVVRPGS